MAVQQEDPWRLRAALQGDADAWEALVDEFASTIWHWARSCGLERHDAEDVAQVVWYKLKDRGHTIRDPRRLPGWLAVTTRHEAIATKKQIQRSMAYETSQTGWLHFLADAQPQPDDLVLLGETRRRIAASYQDLSETCRELLAMSWAGLSVAEIADALGRTTGYVGPTKMRCLRSLREGAGIDD